MASDEQSPPPYDGSLSTSVPSPHSSTFAKAHAKNSLKIPLPSHLLRSSFPDLRSSNPNISCSASPDSGHSGSSSSPEVTAAAATMRWAAARVNLSPLALPSPEHELTDPMRGITATIPGSHAADVSPYSELLTPGGTRKTRLASFWRGTQDIEERSRLSTIAGSPSSTPPDPAAPVPVSVSLPVPPASVPVLRAPDAPTDDYFGETDSFAEEYGSASISSSTSRDSPQGILRAVAPLAEMGTVSVPALPRRICLTRQTSSPLPASSSREPRLPGGRVASESITSVKAGRAAKEEQMFAELGYLAPPNPPDELERRRALYK